MSNAPQQSLFKSNLTLELDGNFRVEISNFILKLFPVTVAFLDAHDEVLVHCTHKRYDVFRWYLDQVPRQDCKVSFYTQAGEKTTFKGYLNEVTDTTISLFVDDARLVRAVRTGQVTEVMDPVAVIREREKLAEIVVKQLNAERETKDKTLERFRNLVEED